MARPRTQRWVLLAGILLLAAFLRLYRLRTMPWGLSQDEVVNADTSLSVLAGEGAPFLSGGYGHEPLFHYLQAVTLILFGDNVVGIRMPAVMLGMLLVSASSAMMRACTSTQRGTAGDGRGVRASAGLAATVTAGGLAVSWWPIIFSRVGIRAIAFPLLLTLAVILLWRGLKRRRRLLVLFSGFGFGLTVYTYTAARVLPALALAWVAYAALFQRAALQRHWRALASAGLIAVIVALPLILYLYAHPEIQERVQQLEGPLAALRAGDPRVLLEATLATLGMFSYSGEARWTYGIPGRAVLGPLSGFLFYAGLTRCIVQPKRPICGLLGPWLIIALVPSMVTPDAPSTIRAIGALPAVYGLVGLGAAWIWEWYTRRRRPVEFAGPSAIRLAILLCLVGAAHLAWTVRDGFGIWAGDPEVYWRYKAHFADVAAFLDGQPSPHPAVVFEEWVDPVDVDGLRRNLVHDDLQPRWAQAGRSFIWPVDADRFTLAMPIFSSADPDVWRLFSGDPPVVSTSAYRMPDGRPGVTFYAIESQPILSDYLARTSGALSSLQRRHSDGAPASVPDGTQTVRLPADFGDQVSLLGYELLPGPDGCPAQSSLHAGNAATSTESTNQGAGGDELRLITVWRILRDSPEPIVVFVHLLDQDGNLIGQHDGFDVWTAALRRGDVVAQLHPIPLNTELPCPTGEKPGAMAQVGVYFRADGVRLPVLVDGTPIADRILLDPLRVGDAP